MTETKTKLNQTIKSTYNLNELIATTKAKSLLKQTPGFTDGYILVDCPDICDLFIVEKSKLRKCTGEEWGYYFRTYLYPVN